MTNRAKAKGDRAELAPAKRVAVRVKQCQKCGSAMVITPRSRRVYCEECRRQVGAEKARRQRAQRRTTSPPPEAPWHGTAHGYSNWSCRCDRCRSATRAYSDEWRKRPGVAERIRARARDASKKPHAVLAKKAYQYGLDRDLLGGYLADRVCFACGAEDVDLSVDHDHSCCPSSRKVCGSCVRGLLCRGCNLVLGYVGDDVERLRALVAYLERWEQRASE